MHFIKNCLFTFSVVKNILVLLNKCKHAKIVCTSYNIYF